MGTSIGLSFQMNTGKMQSATSDFLGGGGEMGALIRAHDWKATAIGPLETWPQGLRTALRILLTSQHPMFIWWGPELIQFYNDAYCKTMGPERHPGALGQRGRECWGEIWDIIGPQIEYVLAGKGATWNEDHLVPVTRHGRRENVWWTYGYSPIDDETLPGGVGGVLVVCNDVTAQHEAMQRQDLLLRELNHRVKNLFAVMNGIVALSARSPGTGAEIAKAIRGRLTALASANDLILPDLMRGGEAGARATDMGALAKAVLAPYAGIHDGDNEERVMLAGPHVRIADKTATSLALVLHEFATNAAKYGALSGTSGKVALTWVLEADRFTMVWRESGGPHIERPPETKGFGSVLAARSVEGQLGGTLSYDWLPDGVKITLAAPAEHLVG